MTILTPRKRLAGKPESRRTPSGSPGRRPHLPWRSFPGLIRPLASHRWRRRILYVGAAMVLFGVISVVAFAAWVSQDLPDPNRLNSRAIAQSTKIYARDGTTLLYEIHGEERRTLVELNEIGKYTKQATLSIEDKDFYKHGGISLRGTLRAIWADIVTGSKAQGGSTITQQLVKNAILTSEKSYIRKMKEWVLAYQIERRFSKDQILKLYFNEIPYGSNAYGIEAAAQTYFNKRAKDLDLAESALLTAILPAPSYYSPRGNHPDELLGRWRLVLDTMAAQKYITRAEADAAKQIDVLDRVSPTKDRVLAPHFVFYVRDLLEEKYGTAELERGGLRVVTTLDPELQKIAEEEVAAGAARNERYSASNAALVAIEPRSGQLLSMVGSRDYFDTDRDGNFNVATALRNPGSSFKPIVYLTAFLKGYSPDTMLFDLKTDFGPDGSGKNFSPNNYDFREHGPLKMRQALAGSLNIPAVKTLYLAGIPDTVETASRLGYTTLDSSKLGLALAIGGGAVRLIEHVGAFATLANDGVRNPVTPFLRVEDGRGKVLELYEERGSRVIEEQGVRQLVDVMSDNGARSFVFGSRSPLVLSGRPVAAKTGTTNDFKDGWTLGFTKQLAAGVWVGNNDNSEMRSGSDGVVVAAPIWNAFMRRALEGDPVEQFTRPKPVTSDRTMLNGRLQNEKTIFVDSETGKKIPDECLSSWPEEYVAERIVKEVHTILHYVRRDDPTGDPPKNPADDPMYERWERAVQDWAKKNRYLSREPATESCDLRAGGDTPRVAITSPSANATISESDLPVTVAISSFDAVRVVYSIDGETLSTQTEPPFSATLDLDGVSNGFRTLRVVAYSAAETSVSAQVPINVLKSGSAKTLYFISPSAKTTVSAADFPYAVRVFVYDPSGITSVALVLKRADGSTETLAQVTEVVNNVASLSWSTTPPGSYQLSVTVRPKKGASYQSDFIPVTVK